MIITRQSLVGSLLAPTKDGRENSMTAIIIAIAIHLKSCEELQKGKKTYSFQILLK